MALFFGEIQFYRIVKIEKIIECKEKFTFYRMILFYLSIHIKQYTMYDEIRIDNEVFK